MRKVDLEAETKKLVANANQELTMGLREQEKTDVLALLRLKVALKTALKQKISGDEYPNSVSELFSKTDVKIDKDVLSPAFEEQAKKASEEMDLAQTLIETYCGKQINIMRAINQLESQIALIIKRSGMPTPIGGEEIVFSEEAQDKIIERLNIKRGKLIQLKKLLDGVALEMGSSIIAKILANLKLRSSKKKIEDLRSPSPTFKPFESTSDEKWLDELALESLEKEIAALNARKELLLSSPEELAKEILELSDSGKQDEAIMALRNLELLSMGTSIETTTAETSRYVTVAVSDRSLNDFKRIQKTQENKLVYLQKSGGGKLPQIAKMVSSVCACLYLINESELAKEKIMEEKSKADSNNDLKASAALRKNLSEIETVIKALKDLMEEYYAAINNTLDYTNENLSAQVLQEYLIGQTSIEISQMESGIKASTTDLPVEEIIQIIGAKSMLIGKHYELPATHDEIVDTISGQAEEVSMLTEFKKLSETYELNPKPKKAQEAVYQVEDNLETLNPNSFGSDFLQIPDEQAQDSYQVDKQPTKDFPLSGVIESGSDEKDANDKTFLKEMEEVPEQIDLAQASTPISTEIAREQSEDYTLNREHAGNVILFPPSPNPKVTSIKNVAFGPDLKELAVAGVSGDLKEGVGLIL